MVYVNLGIIGFIKRRLYVYVIKPAHGYLFCRAINLKPLSVPIKVSLPYKSLFLRG